jgi:1,2-diacylglycerol 3-alpha-glucosyltransferase
VPERHRVALIYHFFAHYREAVIRALAASPGLDLTLIGDDRPRTPSESSIKTMEMGPGLTFRKARCWFIANRLMLQPGIIKAALGPYDSLILLGNAAWPCTWIAAALGRLTGKRVYFWTHGWTRRDRGLARHIRRTFYRLAHGLLLYGHMAKMEGIAQGFDPARLHVIYNSLDYEAHAKVREAITPEQCRRLRVEMFNDPDTPVVVCVARLMGNKRLDMLLRAAAANAAAGMLANVLLVGDGPERSRLEALARELNIRVVFAGSCYDEAMLGRCFRSASVCVSPGNVGLTAMHALAYGTPVVTHDDWENQMPEFESIIPGQTGGLYRAGDESSLASHIAAWTHPSPGVAIDRAAVARACVRVCERVYCPSAQVAAIEHALSGKPADDLLVMGGRSCGAGECQTC